MNEDNELEGMTNEELDEASGGCAFCQMANPYGPPVMLAPVVPCVAATPYVPAIGSPYAGMPYTPSPYAASPYGGMPYGGYGLGTAI